MADIELLFGVKGGGEISGESGKRIKEQLEDIVKAIEPLKVKVEVDKSSISGFKEEVSKLANHSNNATKKLTEGVKGYGSAIAQVNSKMIEVRKKINAMSAAENGSTAADYSKLKAQAEALDSLKGSLERGELSAKEFALAFEKIKSEVSSAYEAIDRANRAFAAGTEIKQYNNQLDKVDRLLIKTKKNLENWSAAKTGKSSESYRGLEETVEVLEELRRELKEGEVALTDFSERFDPAAAAAKSFAADIELAGENTKSVKTRLSDLAKTLGVSFSIADAFHKAIEIGREMIDTVTEIDTAMTELKKVTDETDATYDRFLENAEPRARALGATVADVVSASSDFARLGHSIPDASSLADAAIVYKNVGDGIGDIATASESIISTMQAFKIEAKDAMSIVDAFNITGNSFAISSGGIGDALSRSAAALAAGNNTLAESIALITATNSTLQNTAVVGTAMKTISMFLRASKSELEEAGESTEGMAESVSELRQELLDLTGQQVDIQIDEDNFKSTYEIIKELAKVWDQLTDVSQANILELIGGKLLPQCTVMCIQNASNCR